jgi:uncharacterized protein
LQEGCFLFLKPIPETFTLLFSLLQDRIVYNRPCYQAQSAQKWCIVKYHFIEEEFSYTGHELSNHWTYKNYGILGDSVVSFIGPCTVETAAMVDLEDVLNNDEIYSPRMLHFIIEVFGIPLKEGVLLQRLFSAIIQGKILDHITPESGFILRRSGDDLFLNDTKKLSVSICTVTPTSILIHCGLNIETQGTPVEAAGLASDLGISQAKVFAQSCMKTLAEEWEDIQLACCKVKAVG